MMDYFNLDIFKFLHIEFQLIFIVCDKNNESLKIKYLVRQNFDFISHIHRLNDMFLKKYCNPKELDARNNEKITKISHMVNLKKLNASYQYRLYSSINDDELKGLNFIELDASYNDKITNVSHMTNLKILDAHGNRGIDDAGIQGLNLDKLIVSYNNKITNVSHMSGLKLLIVSPDCEIDEDGIRGLEHLKIRVYDNNIDTMIYKLPKMLIAEGKCGISDI